jgi:DNA-binding LytR/AlgR family response regulator
MIAAVAIDDEKNALDIIKDYAGRMPDMQLVKTFTNPEQGLAFVHSDPAINLVFLDIRMAKMNGLVVAERLPSNVKIVLTTAYSDYAMMGYEVGALDYLLKPFSFDRFERAVGKVHALLNEQKTAENPRKKLLPTHDDILLVKADHKIVKIRLNELLYVEGAGNYLILHTLKGKILTLSTMKVMEEQLVPYQFLRIHKSFIVSFLHIDAIEKSQVIIAGKEIPISESYKDALLVFLGDHYNQI